MKKFSAIPPALPAVLLLLFFFGRPLAAEPVSSAMVGRLAEVLRTNHPALRALGHRADAARENAEGIRKWADPQARAAGVLFTPRGAMPSQDGDLLLGVSQALPVMGKEKAARKVADEEAQTAITRAESRWIELRRELSIRLAEVALAERILALDETDLEWLRMAERNADALNRSGRADSALLLRLRNELSSLENALVMDRSRLNDSRMALNRLLGGTPETESMSLQLPTPLGELQYAPALLKTALNAEPRLRMARREIRESEARTLATRRSSRPDLSLGLDTRQYSGDGGLREGMFTFSVSLPWFNGRNYRRDLARENARLEAARSEQADMEAEVSVEVHHLVSMINSTGREAFLGRDVLIPRSRDAFEIAKVQWSAGRGELREVLELRRQWIEAELRFANASAAQWNAISDLLLCCGLDDLEAFQVSPSNPASSNP
jgi:outer membrane protein TolC